MTYDYMFHTTDSNFSGMGIVDANDEAEAKKLITADVKRRRPDVEVRLIRVEASDVQR